jgi:hypothetical protein
MLRVDVDNDVCVILSGESSGDEDDDVKKKQNKKSVIKNTRRSPEE